MKITWKQCRNKSGKISLSTGNLKLVSSDETRFLIWNIPAKTTCPYRTKLCELLCYAVKAERNYPDCLPARLKNLEFSKTEDFVPFMIEAIHYICNLKAYKNAKKIVFRIHESGDFYNKKYLLKWVEIIKQCADVKNLVFMAYTKSFPFFIGLKIPKNFRIRASVWDDTKPEQLELIKKLGFPVYTVKNREEWKNLPRREKCFCADCGKCGKCWNTQNNNLYVELH